eukprot:6211013-Pleurochrysis_carterae.AAC.1
MALWDLCNHAQQAEGYQTFEQIMQRLVWKANRRSDLVKPRLFPMPRNNTAISMPLLVPAT